MKQIQPIDIPALVEGSLFYGTGGGGDPQKAKRIWERLAKEKKLPTLVALDELAGGICVTAFPVGGLKAQAISQKIIQKALVALQKRLSAPIVGVIPVEIGSLSLALSAEVCALLSLPLVDADFVGGRSTPEVFLETITLFDIPRTPLVIVNSRGDMAILEKASSPRAEEDFLRNFSTMTKGFAYVFGYPITTQLAKRTITQNTVSKALLMGQSILEKSLKKTITRLGGKVFATGTISSIEPIDAPGFSAKLITVTDDTQTYRVFIKNENMILWRQDVPLLTCPDLIVIVDKNDRPVFNQDIQVGMSVSIIGLPAAPLWRTKKGKALFNPRLFGYSFSPVLLPTI